jgi:hypothetical protein
MCGGIPLPPLCACFTYNGTPLPFNIKNKLTKYHNDKPEEQKRVLHRKIQL